MNANFSNPERNSGGIIDIMARENDAKDIDHMNRVVEYLKEYLGYEEVYGDGDNNIILGNSDGSNIEEMKQDYRIAKKSTKDIIL